MSKLEVYGVLHQGKVRLNTVSSSRKSARDDLKSGRLPFGLSVPRFNSQSRLVKLKPQPGNMGIGTVSLHGIINGGKMVASTLATSRAMPAQLLKDDRNGTSGRRRRFKKTAYVARQVFVVSETLPG